MDPSGSTTRSLGPASSVGGNLLEPPGHAGKHGAADSAVHGPLHPRETSELSCGAFERRTSAYRSKASNVDMIPGLHCLDRHLCPAGASVVNILVGSQDVRIVIEYCRLE